MIALIADPMFWLATGIASFVVLFLWLFGGKDS